MATDFKPKNNVEVYAEALANTGGKLFLNGKEIEDIKST